MGIRGEGDETERGAGDTGESAGGSEHADRGDETGAGESADAHSGLE